MKKLNARTLAKLLRIAGNKTPFEAKSLRVLRQRLMVYRFEKSKRAVRPAHHTGKTKTGKMILDYPTLRLPAVNRKIRQGWHYVVAAVDFRTVSDLFGVLHWVALVEAETLSVLYLRALVDHVCGLVFQADPMTLAGGPHRSADDGALNPLRELGRPEGIKCSSCRDALVDRQHLETDISRPIRSFASHQSSC